MSPISYDLSLFNSQSNRSLRIWLGLHLQSPGPCCPASPLHTSPHLHRLPLHPPLSDQQKEEQNIRGNQARTIVPALSFILNPPQELEQEGGFAPRVLFLPGIHPRNFSGRLLDWNKSSSF